MLNIQGLAILPGGPDVFLDRVLILRDKMKQTKTNNTYYQYITQLIGNNFS